MDNTLKLIGRILVTLPMGIAGYFHFAYATASAASVPHWLPFAIFWVYFTAVVHIAYPVMVIGKLRYAGWVSLVMACILLFYAFAIHFPALMAAGSDNVKSMTELGGVMTDTASAGAALFFAGELSKK
jgi:hypothetical protein